MSNTLSRFPTSSSLVKDYINHFDRVKDFFNLDFRDPHKQQGIDNIKDQPRKELAKILLDQNREFGSGKKTLANIERLAEPESRAVVTGQQVGLFGGPLYTFYKALTTLKLAKKLQTNCQRTVVPVFYMVSEDHDFDEVRWTGIIDKKNQYQKIIYAENFHPDRQPVSNIILDDSIEKTIESLDNQIMDTEFKTDILQTLKSQYRKGRSFSHAFACWFAHLLSDYGVILLDASDRRLKSLALPVFERELRQEITFGAISQNNKGLQQKGYHQQLDIMDKRPALFLLQQGRHSLEYRDGHLVELSKMKSFDIEELLDQPQKLSPKAALRPVVQDYLLPTIAYVAGPGEIAYWAQLKNVYREFEIHMPSVFPRADFTLLETKTLKHLKRFGIEPSSFIKDSQNIQQSILENLVPEELKKTIEKTQTHLEGDLKTLANIVKETDPTLQSVIDRAGKTIKNQINLIETKVQNAIANREKITKQQLASLQHNLLPDGDLQERKISAVQYLCKYGRRWIEKIYDHIDLDIFTHKFVELDFDE
ncbi:bacillithiol biosynthesis cysteine-adding enzyme BshC [candidate division KSB1 bacterium]|nr:bacillithiol biosynthesis cysteine-adding enzyme BshC [candidate division KSB1 bacterium]